MDPRLEVISTRFDRVGRILAITGGKGGIGKSLVAAGLALELAASNHQVGLLDLDFTGPCAHLILGAGGFFPAEDCGLVPPLERGLRFMSIAHFTGGHPVPLRGVDVSNALIELLAITQWGELDFLVVDMPPGLGDATLDLVRLLPAPQFLVLSTASRVVLETVERTLQLLDRLQVQILGVVENMQRRESPAVAALAAAFGLSFLSALPFDPEVEEALGDSARLQHTAFAAALRRLAARLLRI